MSYIPNKISLFERILNSVCSVLMLVYGSYGIYINDFFVLAKRGSGIHLHDESALIMYGAFVCGALVMLSVVVDHYDERDNEHRYRVFGTVLKYIGWSLFTIALFFDLFRVG
ncbi:MAG: hypothetical protein KDI30_02680 [Pseudomonadales bacterium]|nr:hypothetical protein [Pseudomonadales bacterium]